MRRRAQFALYLLLLASTLVPTPSPAQDANTLMLKFAGVPSGSCAYIMEALNTITNHFYVCPNGSWVDLGAGAGSGIVSPNSGSAGAIGVYAAAGGSTTVGPDAILNDSGTILAYTGKITATGSIQSGASNSVCGAGVTGAFCGVEGATGLTPTAGQGGIRFDSVTNKIVFSINGGAEAPFPVVSLPSGSQGLILGSDTSAVNRFYPFHGLNCAGPGFASGAGSGGTDRGSAWLNCINTSVNGVAGIPADATADVATAININTNPIPTSGVNGGILYMPSGQQNATVPLQIKNVVANFEVIGTGIGFETQGTTVGGDAASSTWPTVIQAQAGFALGSGLTYCPGLFTFGPCAGSIAQGLGPFGSKLSKFTIDANAIAGVIGLSAYGGQQETSFRDIKIQNSAVAGIDAGASTNSINNGLEMDDIYITHGNPASCPINTAAATVGTWSIVHGTAPGIVVINYTPGTITPYPGMTALLAGANNGGTHATNINGIYEVVAVSNLAGANQGNWVDLRASAAVQGSNNLFSSLNQFAIAVNISNTFDDSGTAAGTAKFFPQDFRENGVIGYLPKVSNMTAPAAGGAQSCSNAISEFPELAFEFSGLGANADYLESEGHVIAVAVGLNNPTRDVYITNIKLGATGTTALQISNQWGNVTNSQFYAINAHSGTNAIIDQQNSNTLTSANNPYVGFYTLDNTGSVFTDANPVNCTELQNGVALYNGLITTCVGGLVVNTLTVHSVSTPLKCVSGGASGTAYTCTTTPTFAPADGDIISFEADVASGVSPTLVVNSQVGTPQITKLGGTANLTTNDLRAGGHAIAVFDGANWQDVSPVANAGAGSSTWTSMGAATANNTPVNNANFNTTQGCTLTGATDCFDFVEQVASTGTGAQVEFETLANSTAVPLEIVQGNMTTAANPGTSAPTMPLASGNGGPASSGTFMGGTGGIYQIPLGAMGNYTGTPTATYGAGSPARPMMTTAANGYFQLLSGPGWPILNGDSTGVAGSMSHHSWRADTLRLTNNTLSTSGSHQEAPLFTTEHSLWRADSMASFAITAAGTGYAVNDVLVVPSSVCSLGQPIFTVTSVSSGGITGLAVRNYPGTTIPQQGAGCSTTSNVALQDGGTLAGAGGAGSGSGGQITVTAGGAATYNSLQVHLYPCTFTLGTYPYNESGSDTPCVWFSSGFVNTGAYLFGVGGGGGLFLQPQNGGGTFGGIAGAVSLITTGGGINFQEQNTSSNVALPYDIAVLDRSTTTSGVKFGVNINGINGGGTKTSVIIGNGCPTAGCGADQAGGDGYITPGLSSGAGAAATLHLGAYVAHGSDSVAQTYHDAITIAGAALPNVAITNVISSYDGMATAGIGTPIVLGTPSDLTAQTTSLTTQNLLASTPAAGKYRVSYYLDQSATCATSPTVFLTLSWTDASNARSALSVTLTMAAAQSSASGSVQGIVPIWAANASAITYTTTLGGGAISTCSYDVHADVERMR